jgi:DNA-binding MarR family transcriptional regulator
MQERQPTDWKFLTNHGLALLCIAADPGVRLRDIAARIGITERAAHRIVSGLVETGYVDRTRTGRRNTYEVRTELPLKLPLERDVQLGELLAVIATPPAQAL